MQRLHTGIILSTVAIAFILVALLGSKGSFDRIICERRERAYTTCQMEKIRFGNLVSTETSFRLNGAEVEEYRVKDAEGDTYTAYRIRLITPNQPMVFHDYDRDYQQAYTDVGQFHDLLSGFANPSLQIEYAIPQTGFILILLALPTIAAIYLMNSRYRRRTQ